MIEEIQALVTNDAVQIIGGFVVGFLVSRFTMSKTERKQYEQTLYDNSIRHTQQKEERATGFKNAMVTYCAKTTAPTLEDFQSVAIAGELYFGELRMIADAILSGKIGKSSRDRTFVPDIVEALQKSIPSYYETLQSIARRCGAEYGGTFKRSNYESMYEVAERYGRSANPPE